jgi:hypothetical protein
LWAEDGQLRYQGPRGALDAQDLAQLRKFRPQIVSLLERSNTSSSELSGLEPRPGLSRAPLTFSQWAHWNLWHLGERRVLRGVTSVTRLLGRLDLDALRRSVSEIYRRHGALRTQIVVSDGVPVQEIAAPRDYVLELETLTDFPESRRETELTRWIDKLLLAEIDVAFEPLFQVRLMRVRDEEHVLLIAMEHMISDGYSLNLIVSELFTAYTDIVSGRPLSLPHTPLQFAEYAVWQQETFAGWIEKQGPYWSRHFTSAERLRFPQDCDLGTPLRTGWQGVTVHIPRELKAELSEWCRLNRTTLVMSLFAAYAALVLRWCNTQDGIFQYQSDARVSPRTEHTVGYLSSALYLKVRLIEGQHFLDLIDQCTQEYCRAHEQADFSFIASQTPRPEFTRSSLFNWVPRGSPPGFPGLAGSARALTCLPVAYSEPILQRVELDYEPAMLLHDSDDGIVAGVHFPASRFEASRMQKYARNFLVFVRALLGPSQAQVNDIQLVE